MKLFLSLISLFSISFLGAMQPEEQRPMRDARSLKANCARFLLAHPEIPTLLLPKELQEYMELESYASGEFKEFCTPECAQEGFEAMIQRDIRSPILLNYFRSLNPKLSVDSPLSNYHPASPFMFATLFNDKATMNFLLEQGADVNYQDATNGWTVLFFAARNSQIDIIQLLLDWGANPLIKNSLNFTARDYAFYRSDRAIPALLQKAEEHRAAIDQVRKNKNVVSTLCNRQIGKKN